MRTLDALGAPDVEEMIHFKWYSSAQSHARLRVWTGPQVALLMEVDSNLGPSITNAAENAWHEVERRLGVLVATAPDWLLVEHYDWRRLPTQKYARDDGMTQTFDRVRFAGRDTKGHPQTPTWNYIGEHNRSVLAAAVAT